jgi:hypothetical protein
MGTSNTAPELELVHLLGELYRNFSSADAPGRAGLVDRLTTAYRYQLGAPDFGDARRRPAGPRDPGRTGPLFAREEIDRGIVTWARWLTPGDRQPWDARQAADLLPTLAVQRHGGDYAREVLHDVQSHHRVALLVLGLEDAPRTMQGEDAPRCLHCHKQQIMYDRNATLGDVWCGNAGWQADACHDDARWSSCRDVDGTITCRRSARSVRHAYRWDHSQLPLLAPARSA